MSKCMHAYSNKCIIKSKRSKRSKRSKKSKKGKKSDTGNDPRTILSFSGTMSDPGDIRIHDLFCREELSASHVELHLVAHGDIDDLNIVHSSTYAVSHGNYISSSKIERFVNNEVHGNGNDMFDVDLKFDSERLTQVILCYKGPMPNNIIYAIDAVLHQTNLGLRQ